MMGRFGRRWMLAAVAAMTLAGSQGVAQERGDWRPASSTARGVTGDLIFTDGKLTINFNSFVLAQIRELKPAEIAAVFDGVPADAPGSGNLFRTSIPGDKRFLHKNTLCGSEDTQWVVTYVTGKMLQVAFFSGGSMPVMTAEGVANNTSLCGTYSYTR